MLEASQFVETVEKRQGFKIACLEEIALHNSWLSAQAIAVQVSNMGKGQYSAYLKELLGSEEI
jgi:glucose-1-phosphate thymidylyltransferase